MDIKGVMLIEKLLAAPFVMFFRYEINWKNKD